MALDPPVFLQKAQNVLVASCILIFVTVLIIADSTESKNLDVGFGENLVYSNGNISNWYHCPQDWTLFINQCYKVTEAYLTWTQAQALCRSYGGNLIKITSQLEQDWVSQFVREQLGSVYHDDADKKKTISNVADVSSIEAWIGFVQLPNKSFQWSDGQAGVEQEGFWAVEGFKASSDMTVSKLCCDIKAQSQNSKDLRWQLTSCDELHSSVCEIKSCEEHTEHCADGSKCVNKAWLCDGYWDCQDGSDERNCEKSLPTSYAAASPHCGSVFKGQSGTFWSPNFPKKYSPFLNCLWKIETTPPQVIEIQVITLDLEENYDILNFYEGTEVSENQLIVSLSGRMHNQNVKSQGSFVTVYFVSDYSVQTRGFNITWKAELETKPCCGQLVAGDQESVLSFYDSENNTSSSWSLLNMFTCDWTISSRNSTSLISLQFKNITLMNEDRITVYDGKGSDSPVITDITSAIGTITPSAKQDFIKAPYTFSLNIPPVITSSGQHLLLRVIISRGSFSSFVIAYKNGCDTFISSSSSLILSPGHPKSMYSSNLDCTWVVPSDILGRHLTLILLPHFLTEPDNDYVQVFSILAEQQVTNATKISGLNTGPQSDISSFHGFVIKFVTDSTVNRGQWAVVVSYDCVPISVLPPLILNSTDIQFGATVEYSCVKGFQLVGPTHSVCGWSGQWLPSNLPTCTKINCGTVPVPDGAYLINTTGLTYGSCAQYQCLYGYTLVGHHEVICGEHGWENVPSCKLITCHKDHPPIGGNARAEDIKVGYLREYFCKSNLELVGSKLSHCNISGQWTADVPVCEAQKCPSLYGLIGGQLNITGPVAIGRSIHFLCDEGYKLIGQEELTCMDNLQFNYPFPSCVDINECENSEICGIHRCQNFIGGYSCFCNDGYKNVNNSYHMCVDVNECDVNNGGCSHTCINKPGYYICGCPQNMNLYRETLDQTLGVTLIPNRTCIASCNSIGAAQGMNVMYQQKPLSNGLYLHGTKADIICPSGHYVNGASVVSCVIGIGWSPPVTYCTELFCKEPKNMTDGTVSYSNLTLGSSVSYSCDPNLTLQGPRIRFCVKEFNSDLQFVKLSWSGREPSCASVTCPDLQNPVHGRVDFSSTTHNSVAVFRCQCGYQLVGLSVVKCMQDGFWSNQSPTCEAQSCLHPGLPSQASMLVYTPGFPVESTVRFQCFDQGYMLSNQDSIKCLPYKQAKISTVKPSMNLTIIGQFVPIDQVNLTRACIPTYRAEELVNMSRQMIIHLCEAVNVGVDVEKDNLNTLVDNFLNITVHLLLSSDNASMICHCHEEIQQYYTTTLNQMVLINSDSRCPHAILKLNTPLTIEDHWYCGSGLRLEDGKQQCGQGTLPTCLEDCIDEGIETLDSEIASEVTTPASRDASNENVSTVRITLTDTTPATVFTEESLKETDTSTQQVTDFSTLQETRDDSTPKNAHYVTNGVNQATKQPFSDETTTELHSTIKPNPTTQNLELLKFQQITTNTVTSSNKNNVQQTDSSIKFLSSTLTEDKLTLTTSSIPSDNELLQSTQPNSSPFKNTIQLTLTTEKSFSSVTTTESVVTAGSHSETSEGIIGSSISTTLHPKSNQLTTVVSSTDRSSISIDPLRFEYPSLETESSVSPQGGATTEFFKTSETRNDVSRESTTRDEVTQPTTSSTWTAAINCTAYTEHHENKHFNSSLETTSSWSVDSGHLRDNSYTTDCMTTHAIEKQTVTLDQRSSLPSQTFSAPVYSVEIYDYMMGSFSNISCIDAVHISINAKVNELLREFGNEIGKLVCKDAPDSSLELTAGNIKFKGTRAKIFIKFSITYFTSSKASVMSCGVEFQSYVASHLPRKLEKVESENSVSQCKYVNYSGQGLNITYHGWACHSSYTLDENEFQCLHPSMESNLQTAFFTIATTPNPPTPVLTVPSLSMTFVGTFISSNLEDKVDENCVKEYRNAFIKVLADIEQNLQSRIYKDIYTVVEKDINVTVNDGKIIAEVVVHLLPLKNSVDSELMNACVNFTSVQFHEPSQQTLLATVSKMHISACPGIIPSIHGLKADITKNRLYCSPGYQISVINFKCINEILPMYSVIIDLVPTVAYEEAVCENIFQTSAQQLVEDVSAGIYLGLSSGSICNTSKNILFLQEQGHLFTRKQAVNISIPVTLVHLRSNKTETIDCAEELYNYLKSILSQSISTMVHTLPPTCRTIMSFSQNYTVSNKNWTCFQSRVYNSLTHQCNLVINETIEAQTSGQSLSNRHKRGAAESQLRLQWNATLPTCIDIEPPTFHSCPEKPVTINADQLIPVSEEILLPNVTDNSGMIPIVTVTPDISLPYIFTKNTTVVMTAKDEAGNSAICTMNFNVIDHILPAISCSTHLVTIFTETCQENLKIIYNNTGVTASDNSGFVSIVYDPPEGSVIKIGKVILVTASAVDGSFNVANCSFFARVDVLQGCPEWNLPQPDGGNRSCILEGTNNQDLHCVVSCPADKGFAVQPPDQYVFNGQWLPHNRVPQCVESRFPDYEVRLNFHLPYQGNTTGDCLKEMLNALIESVRPRLLSACWNSTQDLNLTHIESVGTFCKDSLTMMTAKLKISFNLAFHNAAVALTAQQCEKTVLSQLELNDTLQGSCGQIKLVAPSAIAGKKICPVGFTHVRDKCYECPAGSYMSQPTCQTCPKETHQNISEITSCMDLGSDCPDGQYSTEPQCLECPIGKFQNSSGSSLCIACRSGYLTPDFGAKNEEECLVECPENNFSFTGVEPCLPCPIGTHQRKPGSKLCDSCEFDSDGISQWPYCIKPCAPGEYSSTGASPCMLCPQNYFAQGSGSTACTECPDNKMTKQMGCVTKDQCEAFDPCLDNPCNHGSLCQPHGRNVKCVCALGFTGSKCQDKVEMCGNQICQNNKTCKSLDSELICSCPPGLAGVTCSHEVSEIDYCLSNPCVYGSCMNASGGFTCSCYNGFHGDRCNMRSDICASSNPCYNGGVCEDLTFGFKCSCVKGFTGRLCDNKIDDCPEDYCVNGGTCVDDTKLFNCTCLDGFTGDHCEMNIDECASSPCMNEGLCQDGINSFKCLCLPEYSGYCCESIVDPCEANLCLNGATCLATHGTYSGFYCRCLEAYTGYRCEVAIDLCLAMPCSIQGSWSCENTVSSFKCNCLPGWKGNLCDEKMDPCSSHPCLNGAACDNNSDTFTCSCLPPFTGPTCSVSLNACQSSPCKNLATCVEKTFSFLCQCLPGFTGVLCDENIDECKSSPCLNKSLCQDGVGAFTCSCQSGFAGDLCEVNIDECLSQPCQHNSSCNQLDGDFMCNCSSGFTGKKCEIEIDECSSNPCEHQGKCVDLVANFYCACSQGYTGAVCEKVIDDCQNHTFCLNNSTSHKVDGKCICQCTTLYTGPDCGKEKTANFDLHFLGDHALSSRYSLIDIGNLSALSLCLWIKFSQPDSNGTYLVLTSEDGISHFLTLRGSVAASSHFASKEITLYINDGQWHHICLVLSPSHWTVFKNGQNFQEGDMVKWIVGNRLKLKLGQPVDPRSINEWFRGHLNGVNMYGFALNKDYILNMSLTCDFKMHGNLFQWVTADSQVFGDVEVNMPSQCGQTLCSDGDRSYLCSALSEVDKTPPEVVSCPNTIVVTSYKRLVSVTWTEPEFSDNVGIVIVKQNFRSGQIFPNGQYFVIYIGYDAENNSAKCSFQIFVRKFNCVDPPPPSNGARICGEWEHGRYCTPSCTQNFDFVTPIPPFYHCGYEGIWDFPSGDPYTFPLCARTYPPAHNIYGGISFEGPLCANTYKIKLQEKLVGILTQLDNVVHLCSPDQVCNNIQDVNIECGVDTNRQRRAVNSDKSMYTVAMNISLSTSLSGKLTDPDSIPEKLICLIKQNQTENEFFLASDDLHVSSHCQTGQMLTNTNKPQCLDCPAGYFMTKDGVCSPCPSGWYNDKPLQMFCIQCADGLTTLSEGATSSSQCFAVCEAGTYFSVRTSRCEPCPVGEYQYIAGQSSCKPCPVGLTTLLNGANSVNYCQDICGAGQELGVDGTCVDCPLGTYSTGQETSSVCTTCPYGWTTENERAVDQIQCTIKKCDKGHYRSQKDKTCYPCPLGTFQESRGATSCEPCGVRLTTNQEGADSRSLCRPGKVNECELKIGVCSSGTKCVDLDDGYSCEYFCETYCSSLSLCDDVGKDQVRECQCPTEMCKENDSRDSLYKSLVTASIVVTVIAIVVLIAVIVIIIYRRNHRMDKDKHVRMYRDETELTSFTNEAFDSFSTHADSNREKRLLQMPKKMATRWHNHNFMSTGQFFEDEIESADL